MSIDDSVFKSILALDAYNRGSNPSITLSTGALGNATLYLNSDGIGSLSSDASTYDFFAQSYIYNGKTVVAYRGTDSLIDVLAYKIGDTLLIKFH